MVLNGVSIGSNVENISIINSNTIFKPIVLIYYNKINLWNNFTIKFSRIPYVNLCPNNSKEYYEISEDYLLNCKIKSIKSLSRYTIFHFNAPIEIDEKLYTSDKKLVIRGNKIIPYNDMIWN